ncbi:MAG TPA: beta-ketoacyl-[acyl-carrier-protein] synthase family protein [Thermodesulfovibrionales bacterium]|nr:beta-ketoacyl-[acyl-carrier-protein] synthase family protein [Thermodesulfovibrionales bacterium]
MLRTVITGIGSVTPLGSTFHGSWQEACAGKSGIDRVSRIPDFEEPWVVCGEVKEFDPSIYLGDKETRRLDLFAQYAVSASIMAARDAGLIPEAKNDKRCGPDDYLRSGGVIIGSSRGGIGMIEHALLKSIRTPGSRTSPYLMPATTVSMAASYAAQKLGLQGECLGISNACTSGTNAIGEAFRLIRSGYGGPVLAGGADAPICRICIRGYGVTGALSRRPDHTASRPFDQDRDGFVLSEGACVVVVERYETAVKRGAHVYAEITGYGSTADAFHQTRPQPAGEARAMRSALDLAERAPQDIDFISAHGTSTPLGDSAEAHAIQQVFGEHIPVIPVSAMKSMTGHMLAASGAFETASAAMVIDQGLIFPTINLSEQDGDIPLRIVRETTRTEILTALVNSFGFGGVNAVLVLQKRQE